MTPELDRLAGRQHGLATHRQLLELGWTEPQIFSACARGFLCRVRRGVYRTAGSPPTQDQAWLAAVLVGGGAAVLSHGSAAALHGFRGVDPPDSIDLLVSGSARPRHAGIRSHTTLHLPADHVTRVRSIAVTTVERTVVDTCGALGDRHLPRVVSDLERRQALRIPRLVRVADEVPPPGRRAIGPLQRFLAERIPGYDPGGSDAELDVIRLLQRNNRILPVQQHRVRTEGHTYFLDFAFPEVLEGLEWDTWQFHGQLDPFHGDRERLRRLQRAGWRIWPLTSRTSPNEILAIVDEIAARLCAKTHPRAG